ncbi:MAG: hypothetical protein ACREDE_11300, partial [Thermoplasmata archaeon]
MSVDPIIRGMLEAMEATDAPPTQTIEERRASYHEQSKQWIESFVERGAEAEDVRDHVVPVAG